MSTRHILAAAFLAWTAFGVGISYWGYRTIMESCPPFDDFSGCFEPPYRFSALVFYSFWGCLELVLLVAASAAFIARRRRRRSAD